MSLITFLDYASVIVFAITGALVASRAQLDLVGFAFIACLTAVGGGTIRDLLLDRNPIFWIAEPTYLAAAATTAIIIFFTAHLLDSRLRAIIWLDSLALAVAVAAGAAVAISLDQGPTITILMSIVTGCMGELYVTAAFAGAATTVLLNAYVPEIPYSLIIGAGVTWTLRAGSILFGWHLPVYKSAPPKT